MLVSFPPTLNVGNFVNDLVSAFSSEMVCFEGCDVIISKDKGVSRVHAEIVVDALEHLDQRKKKSSDINTKVRIRDCSKYGTFITRGDDSKEKVHESPSKEIVLKEGDLLSFGTGNAAYRYLFLFLIGNEW